MGSTYEIGTKMCVILCLILLASLLLSSPHSSVHEYTIIIIQLYDNL